MSTKTTFKRVALVAAVAAAFAGLSTVAANASVATTPVLNTTSDASVTQSLTTGNYVSESLTAGTNDSYYTITTSGVGTVAYPSTAPGATGYLSTLTSTSATSEIWSNGGGAIGTTAGTTSASAFDNTSYNVLTFSVYSATAGTQTITVTGSSTAALTYTITWGAAPVFSAGASTAYLQNTADEGTVSSPASDDTVAVSAGSAGALVNAGDIVVTVNNNAATAAPYNGTTVSATITGSGLISVNTTHSASAGSARSASSGVLNTANVAYVHITSDGTSGTGTVVVSVYDPATAVTTVLATKTVTFYGSTIAKLTATVNNAYLPDAASAPSDFSATSVEGLYGSATANATATSELVGTAAVSVVAADANGNPIPSAAGAIDVASSNTLVATVGAHAIWDPYNAYYFPVITAVGEGTTTLTFTDDSTGKIVATAVITESKPTVSSVVNSTDNSSYAAGTAVKYLITAKDAAGNAIPDGTYNDFFTSGDYPTSNYGVQGSLPNAVSVKFTSGINSTTVYAPAVADTVTFAGGTLGAGVSVVSALQSTVTNSTSFTVSTSTSSQASAATDAANEATDAANAATDAANAAADAADAATSAAQDASAKADAALAAVNALSAKITVLAAQIAKIVKKLGA